MKLSELQAKTDNCSDCEWVHPALIEGFDAEEALKNNKERWHRVYENREDESATVDAETPTSIIEYYLINCIINAKIKNELPAAPMEILDVAFYLMTQAGSSEVAFSWPVYRDLFPEHQAEAVMDYIQSSYNTVEDPLVKYLLGEFILDFYKYGVMWVSLEAIQPIELVNRISNEPDERLAFQSYLDAVGDSRNIGNLFHQNKMADSFIDFLGKLYAERGVLEENLRENYK